ncbi:Hypothetical predicted protein [Mytilus galloprovincialis]|uniref:Golgi apparatus membrane protein TVP23 homolog n=1 Tax=Mytilus galloprovincialis TaxID=29158 RepID=A0A8B6E923_MYTGA|nr:Hypothetical predicted protein [Mytilus galloprovincialis]
MDKGDDIALNFGEEDELDRRQKFKHPLAVFFHMFFRSAAIILYFMCDFFIDSFVTSFVMIVIMLSMDFWTVKNVTGRLLVGLRWWNYVDDDGKSNWVYEARKGAQKKKVTVVEARIFWLSLVACEIIWIFLIFSTLLRLRFAWLMIVLVGTAMNGANLYGYIKCKYGANKKLSTVATGFLGKQLWTSMLSMGKSKTQNQTQQ